MIQEQNKKIEYLAYKTLLLGGGNNEDELTFEDILQEIDNSKYLLDILTAIKKDGLYRRERVLSTINRLLNTEAGAQALLSDSLHHLYRNELKTIICTIIDKYPDKINELSNKLIIKSYYSILDITEEQKSIIEAAILINRLTN